MEYMPGGDLRSFLKRSRKMEEPKVCNEKESSTISQSTILQFALDIANGMAHLASRQVRYCKDI